jgi:VIT1/CCC1 family predicted Fe2+/Mn2+ transporter
VILILGVSNLLADGLSMGIGDYLPTKSEREYYDREARRQAWEIEHFPDGQRAELLALLREAGYSEADAEQMVAIQTRDPGRWVDAIMVAELGMLRDAADPRANAAATFASFVAFGSLPLLVYLIGLAVPIAPGTALPVSVGLSAAALFGLGRRKCSSPGLTRSAAGWRCCWSGASPAPSRTWSARC